MRVADQTMTINVFNTLRYMDYQEECHYLQEENTARVEDSDIICCSNFFQIKDFEKLKKKDVEELDETPCETHQVSSFTIRPGMRFEALDFFDFTSPKASLEHAPSLEFKPLPPHLKYVYLGSNETLSVVISAKLLPDQECSLINLLSHYKKVIGWTMAYLKGINPTICMHKVIFEECHSDSVEPQRRLNPTMKKVVMKWLDAGIIYPISDSSWVSHVQCVPKKGGITVMNNEENELLPTQTVTGYNQIAIAPEDQEKTSFTCPYGTYAFRRMPFGLCNAPETFELFDYVSKWVEALATPKNDAKTVMKFLHSLGIRIENEEMLQHSRKDGEQHVIVALVHKRTSGGKGHDCTYPTYTRGLLSQLSLRMREHPC
ncbi:hypothetical protein GQ457_14G014750 [Hibiscus cannabinus]